MIRPKVWQIGILIAVLTTALQANDVLAFETDATPGRRAAEYQGGVTKRSTGKTATHALPLAVLDPFGKH